MIEVGDVVVALRDGGVDNKGLPAQRPLTGKTYRVSGIYPMRYGLGCTLEGMNPSPYLGYLLFVERPFGDARRGWYFTKIAAADESFTAWLKETINVSTDHDNPALPADVVRMQRGSYRDVGNGR